MSISGLEPLRGASLNSVQRAESALDWLQRQLVRLEGVLAPPRRESSRSITFDLTAAELEEVKQLEAAAPIWRPEDYAVTRA